MNKATLFAPKASDTSLSRAPTDDALRAVLLTITTKVLATSEPAKIPVFGTLPTKSRLARQHRNPRTGNGISIAALKAPATRPEPQGRQLAASLTAHTLAKPSFSIVVCAVHRPLPALYRHQRQSTESLSTVLNLLIATPPNGRCPTPVFSATLPIVRKEHSPTRAAKRSPMRSHYQTLLLPPFHHPRLSEYIAIPSIYDHSQNAIGTFSAFPTIPHSKSHNRHEIDGTS